MVDPYIQTYEALLLDDVNGIKARDPRVITRTAQIYMQMALGIYTERFGLENACRKSFSCVNFSSFLPPPPPPGSLFPATMQNHKRKISGKNDGNGWAVLLNESTSLHRQSYIVFRGKISIRSKSSGQGLSVIGLKTNNRAWQLLRMLREENLLFILDVVGCLSYIQRFVNGS